MLFLKLTRLEYQFLLLWIRQELMIIDMNRIPKVFINIYVYGFLEFIFFAVDFLFKQQYFYGSM